MKKLITFIIIIFIALSILFIYKYNHSNIIQDTSELEYQLYETKYFNPISDNFYYGDKMSFSNSIYYEVITDYSEYLSYKENYSEIIDMKNEDFEDNFLVLTVTENESTKNLALESVNADDKTLYIGLNKIKENENSNETRGISIKINKTLFRENVNIFKTIENTDFITNYCDIKQLPKDYSLENAISDNCFVITTNPATNINILEEFLNNVQNGQDAELRIVGTGSDINESIIIYDLKYVFKDNKYYVCVDTSRGSNSNSYNYFEYDTFTEKEFTNTNIAFYEEMCLYELSNFDFPETNLYFSFYNSNH